MKLITRDTDYAVRALIFLARNNDGVVAVSRLVKKLKIPRPFLRKILQTLNKNGILNSYKGQGGGFSLAVNLNKVYLFDLMQIFQGPLTLNECIFKKSPCPGRGTCALRKQLSEIEDDVFLKLKYISIGSLSGRRQE